MKTNWAIKKIPNMFLFRLPPKRKITDTNMELNNAIQNSTMAASLLEYCQLDRFFIDLLLL